MPVHHYDRHRWPDGFVLLCQGVNTQPPIQEMKTLEIDLRQIFTLPVPFRLIHLLWDNDILIYISIVMPVQRQSLIKLKALLSSCNWQITQFLSMHDICHQHASWAGVEKFQKRRKNWFLCGKVKYVGEKKCIFCVEKKVANFSCGEKMTNIMCVFELKDLALQDSILCWRTFKSMMSITRNLPLVIWLQCWNSRLKKFATSWPNYLYSGPIYSTQHMQCNSIVETTRNYIILQHRWKCYDTWQNRAPPLLPFKLSIMVSRTWSFIPSQSGLFSPWFNRSIDNFQLHNCLWSVDNKMANRLCWAIN